MSDVLLMKSQNKTKVRGGIIMRKGLTKIAAMAVMTLIAAGSVSNVASAHGHHSRTAGTTVQYAGCYQDGYCTANGSCDVNGVCQNGGNCTGIICSQDGSCYVNGVCPNGVNHTTAAYQAGTCATNKAVHHATGHRARRHH